MIANFNKKNLINIFYFSFIFILIIDFVFSIIIGFEKESWNIAEFLINYQGGFVRRGLFGELLYLTYNSLGINPYYLILSTCIIFYVILIIIFVRLFIKNGYTLFILPFVFFLGNPIISEFWVRKDILIICFFILIVYMSTLKSNLYPVFINFFLIIGLLIHESIGFFCLPILFLVLISKNHFFYKTENTTIKSIFFTIFQILPSLLTFFCVLYFKGSKYISCQIWNSWKSVSFPFQANDDSQIPSAIFALSWSLKQGLSYTINILTNFNDNIYAPLVWVLILVIIYFILTNTSKLNYKILNYKPYININKKNISNILIFQFISIIPLFILGWDYSRWVFYWTTSSFAIILLVPERELSVVFPKIISTISTKLNNILDLFLNNSNVLLFCIIIGFSPYSWSLKSSIISSSFVIRVC